MPISRRQFNAGLAGSIAGSALASSFPHAAQAAAYRGPNVILVRFGLYRYKLHRFARILRKGKGTDEELVKAKKQYADGTPKD